MAKLYVIWRKILKLFYTMPSPESRFDKPQMLNLIREVVFWNASSVCPSLRLDQNRIGYPHLGTARAGPTQ